MRSIRTDLLTILVSFKSRFRMTEKLTCRARDDLGFRMIPCRDRAVRRGFSQSYEIDFIRFKHVHRRQGFQYSKTTVILSLLIQTALSLSSLMSSDGTVIIAKIKLTWMFCLFTVRLH